MLRHYLLVLILLVSICACDKSEETDISNIQLLEITAISETEVLLKWSASSADFTQLFAEVSTLSGFNELEKQIEIDDISNTTMLFSDLSGATKYYFRLRGIRSDASEVISDVKSVRTIYTLDAVSFQTSDGLSIAGSLSYLSSIESKKPAVIFMHEMGAFVNGWKASEVVLKLVAKGYVCLVIDFRGHGNSTPIDDIGILFTNKELLVLDLEAALGFLKAHPQVDPQRFALAGASLGAIMAVAGNAYEEVKVSVAVSGVRDGIFQISANNKLRAVLYVVGELDVHPQQNVNFLEEAQAMYEMSSQPKKLVVVPGASAHGTSLLSSESLNTEIVDWIDTEMN